MPPDLGFVRTPVWDQAEDALRRGLEAFAAEVRAGTYPAEEHSYHISDAEYALFAFDIERGVSALEAGAK